MTRRPAAGQEGFTLIEALVASGVFAFVLVGIASLFASTGGVYNSGQSKAEVQQNARVALEASAREIRVAGYDQSGVVATLASPTSIQDATASTVTFVADVTGDGVLDQVQYRRSGTQLVRDIATWNGANFPAAASGTIADSVSGLNFAYFDANDLTIAAPVAAGSLNLIKRITISLTTTQTTVNRQAAFPLVVDVRLRN